MPYRTYHKPFKPLQNWFGFSVEIFVRTMLMKSVDWPCCWADHTKDQYIQLSCFADCHRTFWVFQFTGHPRRRLPTNNNNNNNSSCFKLLRTRVSSSLRFHFRYTWLFSSSHSLIRLIFSIDLLLLYVWVSLSTPNLN